MATPVVERPDELTWEFIQVLTIRFLINKSFFQVRPSMPTSFERTLGYLALALLSYNGADAGSVALIRKDSRYAWCCVCQDVWQTTPV